MALDAAASAHLAQVLRARRGEHVVVIDGRGNEYLGHVQEPSRRSCEVRLGRLLRSLPSPGRRLQLLQASIKSGLEGVIQQATELGATAITIFRAERSAPASLRQERALRIAIGATEQSGRLHLPTVTTNQGFAEALGSVNAGERFIALPNTPPLTDVSASADVALAVGPEGGFTEAEAQTAFAAGFRPLGLGPLTLRAATAGPAAIASLRHLQGWDDTGV